MSRMSSNDPHTTIHDRASLRVSERTTTERLLDVAVRLDEVEGDEALVMT